MKNKTKIALIYGSVRNGRFCDKVAGWVAKQVSARPELELDIVDPAFPHARAEGNDGTYDIAWLKEHVGSADAFIVVTPEYNHGYPAAVKSLIDSVGAEWHAKPVAFVSYGGGSGGLRAVEQLRQVFAELHAVAIRDSLSFVNAWEQFEDDGTLRNPERALRGLEILLRRLSWWAETLRNGRNAIPYATAA
jgi:NAD(P)H-dependent FMN reductase